MASLPRPTFVEPKSYKTNLRRLAIAISTQPADQLIATDITRQTRHPGLGGDDFFSNKVQTDEFGARFVIKVTGHCIAHHLPQFLERVCFSENGGRQGFGFKASLGSFLDEEDDFVHVHL